MDISVIIVNYKSKEKTLKCIEAVKQSDMAGLSYEIIVVDNDSGDNIVEEIKNIYPNIVFIQSGENIGMGAGNNKGLRNSKGEFMLILNADTYVNKNTIKMLYNYLAEHGDTGIVGPKLFYPSGEFQPTCFRFPKIYTFVLRRTFLGKYFKKQISDFLMEDYDHSYIKEVDWIMGSCLLIKKEIFKKTGEGFDDRFWMYFEDTDLCRRCWRAGYKVIYDPEATATHDHGRGSAEGKWYLALFNNKLARAHILSWLKYFLKWGIY